MKPKFILLFSILSLLAGCGQNGNKIVSDSTDVQKSDGKNHPAMAVNPNDSQGNSDPWGRVSGLAPADVNYEYGDTASLTLKGGTGGGTLNVQATGHTESDADFVGKFPKGSVESW